MEKKGGLGVGLRHFHPFVAVAIIGLVIAIYSCLFSPGTMLNKILVFALGFGLYILAFLSEMVRTEREEEVKEFE